MSELEIVEKLRRLARPGDNIALGIGDDCAIYRPRRNEELLFTADQSIEGVHLLPEQSPSIIGHNALARSLSDIAAMGGEPRFCLVSLAVPSERGDKFISAFYRGLMALARRSGTVLAGGDLAPIKIENAPEFGTAESDLGWYLRNRGGASHCRGSAPLELAGIDFAGTERHAAPPFVWGNDRAGLHPRQEPHFSNECPGNGQYPGSLITKSLKGPTITPYFRQSSVTLHWDKPTVASKARSGLISGFLSPPAPRGSADRASLSTA